MTTLDERIERGDTIILDGAMGTELERRGVPMDNAAWSATAIVTHPDVVREAHEDYIRAGADIITTNSFATARHMLEAASLGDRTREINARSVSLALEARERADVDWPVSIAGSISTMIANNDPQKMPPEERAEANYREQAEALAEAGAELLILEMMQDIEHTSMALRAAVATGLPTWVGFSCRSADAGAPVMLLNNEDTMERALELVMPLGGSLVAVMHTLTENTAPALEVVEQHWRGSTGAYAHTGRFRMPNWQFQQVIPPEDYLAEAQRWVAMGTQLIGGCCGIGPEYIALLKQGIPSRVPSAGAK